MNTYKLERTKVIIAGGRDFNDYDYLELCMENVMESGILKGLIMIISGHAKGADLLGERYAEERRIPIEIYPAKWKELGRQAGFRRNEEMLEVADALVAFWDGASHGTRHMIKISHEKGIPVWVFPYDKNYTLKKQDEVRLLALEAQWQQKQQEKTKDDGCIRLARTKEMEDDEYFDMHGMSARDWIEFQRLTRRQVRTKWKRFAPWCVGNCDYEGIFSLLRFKLELMVDCFKHFSHCTEGKYLRQQMETACRLLNIVIKIGNENNDIDVFPYRVNLRNVHRFKVCYCPHGFAHGKPQEVRYNKAFSILFRYLEKNIHAWWD